MSRRVYVDGSNWGTTVVRIEMALAKTVGMTTSELADCLGLSGDQVRSVVARMHKDSPRLRRRLHIAGYRRLTTDGGRSYLRAVYALGDRQDARRP